MKSYEGFLQVSANAMVHNTLDLTIVDRNSMRMYQADGNLAPQKLIEVGHFKHILHTTKGTRLNYDDKKAVLCCIYCYIQVLYCSETCSSPSNSHEN